MVLYLTPIKIRTIKLFSSIIGPQYYTSDMHEVQEDTDPEVYPLRYWLLSTNAQWKASPTWLPSIPGHGVISFNTSPSLRSKFRYSPF